MQLREIRRDAEIARTTARELGRTEDEAEVVFFVEDGFFSLEQRYDGLRVWVDGIGLGHAGTLCVRGGLHGILAKFDACEVQRSVAAALEEGFPETALLPYIRPGARSLDPDVEADG